MPDIPIESNSNELIEQFASIIPVLSSFEKDYSTAKLCALHAVEFAQRQLLKNDGDVSELVSMFTYIAKIKK